MPQYFAQYGEDRVLARIFPRSTGYAVEVGAYDGQSGSNTLYFENLGWDCVLVEPNPRLGEKIRNFRKNKLFACAVGAVRGTVKLQIPPGGETLSSVSLEPFQVHRMTPANGHLEIVEVPQRTMDDILSEASVQSIDFVTIDVEGYELEVLRGFDLGRWNPRIVILEDNSSGTDLGIPLFMEAHGYSRFRSSGCNDWYCRVADPLLTFRAVFITETLKALKGVKRVTTVWIRRSFSYR